MGAGTYGRGYIKDKDAKPTHTFEELIGASRRVGAAGQTPVDFVPSIGGVKNQFKTEKCVGFTFAEGLDLRAAALGITIPRPSESGIYALALELAQTFQGGGANSQPLVDMGCQPSLAAQAIRSFGIPSSSTWPFNPDEPMRKMNAADMMAADGLLPLVLSGFAGIAEGGATRIAKVNTLLTSVIPVGIVVPSSTAEFESPDGQVLTAPTTWHECNHMVSLVGLRPKQAVTSDGDWEYLILNHWGEEWGSGGFAWCDESYVQYSEALYGLDVSTP